MEGEGVAEGGSGGGVVEDDPGFGAGGEIGEGVGEGLEEAVRVGAVVGAGRAVEAIVDEVGVACGGCGGRDRGGVGGGAGDDVGPEEVFGRGGEPGWVAGFEDDGTGVQAAKVLEEGAGLCGVEGLFGRELEEDGAEFRA